MGKEEGKESGEEAEGEEEKCATCDTTPAKRVKQGLMDGCMRGLPCTTRPDVMTCGDCKLFKTFFEACACVVCDGC